MKRSLFLALLPLFIALPLAAQEEQELDTVQYRWDSWIFQNDSARFDPFIPYAFTTTAAGVPDLDPTDGTQWRGFGQIVNLGINYEWYDSVFNTSSTIHVNPASGFTDEDYIKQFKGVTQWTADSILFFAYLGEADAQFGTIGGTLSIFKLDVNLRDTNYQRRGLHIAREDLPTPLYENLIDGSALAAAYDPLQGQITAHQINFPVGELSFTKDESMMILYTNDFDDAMTSDQLATADPNPTHRGISYQEYAGWVSGAAEERTMPLTSYKALGVVMYREGEGSATGDSDTDTIHSAWSNLTLGGLSTRMNTRTIVRGIAELDTTSSVRWHYGYDADAQGLGDVVPNPVNDHARIPFSLSKTGTVTIELYDARGMKAATLMHDRKLVAGKYDVAVPVETLSNGTYVARMTTGEEVYSIKFSVTK